MSPAQSLATQVHSALPNSTAGVKKGKSALWAQTSQEAFTEEGLLLPGPPDQQPRPEGVQLWAVGRGLGLQEWGSLRGSGRHHLYSLQVEGWQRQLERYRRGTENMIERVGEAEGVGERERERD